MKSERGNVWFSLLSQNMQQQDGLCPSVKVAHGKINQQAVSLISVVPDENNPFPRARNGEVGLLEGWNLAKAINIIIEQDRECEQKRAIIAIIDVPSQAYGRREEAYSINQALAGAVAAYTHARLLGHPVIGLIVGKAMSGAFLAHGYQANVLIAFDDKEVMTHAMGKESAARITLRSVEELEKLTATIPPMAYDIESFASLGLLSHLLTLKNADSPTEQDIIAVHNTILESIGQARKQGCYLAHRLEGPNRTYSKLVRERMRQEW